MPLAFTPEELGEERRWSQNHEFVARLGSGASLERAQERLDAHNAEVTERAGSLKDTAHQRRLRDQSPPLEADIVRNVRAALQMLWGGVVCVVLIAAVNIANLSLVRATAA